MFRLRIINRLVTILILAGASVFLACTPKMGAPSDGVTDNFFREFGAQTLAEARYDFSRLKRGYGLYVFSFESKHLVGDRTNGFDVDKKNSLHIWEYHFRDTIVAYYKTITREFNAVS